LFSLCYLYNTVCSSYSLKCLNEKSSLSQDFVARGHLVKESDCYIEMIRYNKQIGLIPRAEAHRHNGYGLFGETGGLEPLFMNVLMLVQGIFNISEISIQYS